MAVTNLISPLLWQGIPFDDPDSWTDFLGFHDRWHQVIAKALPQIKGPDPIGENTRWVILDDLKEQGAVHQAMHDQIADRLGISRGGDIASANLKDKNEFTNWQYVHALDHQRFRLVMGI
jgi:hypothetical protein